jgi:hypothetical protein
MTRRRSGRRVDMWWSRRRIRTRGSRIWSVRCVSFGGGTRFRGWRRLFREEVDLQPPWLTTFVDECRDQFGVAAAAAAKFRCLHRLGHTVLCAFACSASTAFSWFATRITKSAPISAPENGAATLIAAFTGSAMHHRIRARVAAETTSANAASDSAPGPLRELSAAIGALLRRTAGSGVYEHVSAVRRPPPEPRRSTTGPDPPLTATSWPATKSTRAARADRSRLSRLLGFVYRPYGRGDLQAQCHDRSRKDHSGDDEQPTEDGAGLVDHGT